MRVIPQPERDRDGNMETHCRHGKPWVRLGGRRWECDDCARQETLMLSLRWHSPYTVPPKYRQAA